ncbi:twin-arginine translocation signal domain-containing protein [Achromobacter xylosoxidans]
MAVSARFDAIAGQAELDALTRAGQGRRRVLRAVALLAGAGGLGASPGPNPSPGAIWPICAPTWARPATTRCRMARACGWTPPARSTCASTPMSAASC